jgi:VIT1/CCC1 family predicted Fe2+/Mn2+ transporter
MIQFMKLHQRKNSEIGRQMQEFLLTVLRAVLAGILTIFLYLILHTTLPFPWPLVLGVFFGLAITQLFTSYLKGESRSLTRHDILKSLLTGLLAAIGIFLGLWIMM